MTAIFSDLILVSEEGTKIPAHRSVLAARSDYFSALLYGSLKEAKEKEIKLLCSEDVLEIVLNFLYSGEVVIDCSNMAFLMDLLDDTRRMCITNLQAALEDLIVDQFTSIEDVIGIFNDAVGKDFGNVIKASRMYLENKVDDILESSSHLETFSVAGFKAFISGNDLDVPEIDIFNGVVKWMNTENITQEHKNEVLSAIRLDQMTPKQLVEVIKPSGMFSDSQVLEAICSQVTAKTINPRKCLLNQNLCLLSIGAKVRNAEKAVNSNVNVIIDGKSGNNNYTFEKGYAMRKIGERMEIELPSQQKINKIRVLLHDKDAVRLQSRFDGDVKTEPKQYSYRIEYSLDGITWKTIIECFRGKSWQTIFFKDKRAKFIGIVGTKVHTSSMMSHRRLPWDTTPRNYIHVVAIEAMLDTNTEGRDRKNSGFQNGVPAVPYVMYL